MFQAACLFVVTGSACSPCRAVVVAMPYRTYSTTVVHHLPISIVYWEYTLLLELNFPVVSYSTFRRCIRCPVLPRQCGIPSSFRSCMRAWVYTSDGDTGAHVQMSCVSCALLQELVWAFSSWMTLSQLFFVECISSFEECGVLSIITLWCLFEDHFDSIWRFIVCLTEIQGR